MSIKGIKEEDINSNYAFDSYGDINVSDVEKNSSLSAIERKILADVLYFDKGDDSYTTNATDPYYQGISDTDTNLAIQLQHVSDDDIEAYVIEKLRITSNPTLSFAFYKIQDVFEEARFLSKDAFSNPLLNKKNVDVWASAINHPDTTPTGKVGFATAIQKAVKAFDQEDNPIDIQITKNDLRLFNAFYGLSIANANAVNSLFVGLPNGSLIPKALSRGSSTLGQVIP